MYVFYYLNVTNAAFIRAGNWSFSSGRCLIAEVHYAECRGTDEIALLVWNGKAQKVSTFLACWYIFVQPTSQEMAA